LLAAAQGRQFDLVLVDDLSRLARDNYLMLSVLAELHFEGVRVVSVADGLDSNDEEATLGIQIRGIFNELQLRDLKKKTLRGQIGQKQRGFSVGERTFGYPPSLAMCVHGRATARQASRDGLGRRGTRWRSNPERLRKCCASSRPTRMGIR
jgi:DNA invertase Pin-like site-specific DNA recombinase